MNINEAFEFLNFISNKNQSGKVSPSEFNQMAERAQWEYFQKDYTLWETTQEITDALSVFQVSLATSIPATGVLTYPSDYVHLTSMRHYFVKDNNQGIEVPVREVDNDEFGDVLQSEIVQPTLRYPIMSAFSTYMRFEPKNLGQLMFDYFRMPISPVWAYTTVNNRAVYDAANSINWELPDDSHNTLIFMMCSYSGINLRESELVNYSELQKQEQK